VLVVIPARNEESHIEHCVRSLLAQRGVQLQVLAINDGSSDQTGPTLDRLAQQAGPSALQVIHLPPSDVPPGWTGKCRAIVRGLQSHGEISHDFVLFIDSDVELEPGAVELAVRLARHGRDGDDRQGHGLVSLLLRQRAETWPERAMVPLCAAVVAGAFGVAYANHDHFRHHAFACGQFMLFKTETYRKIGGHLPVKGDLAEDVELARKVKEVGDRPRVARAPNLGSVLQHAGLQPLLRQWARNLYGNRHGRPWTLLGPLGFILFQTTLLLAATLWTVHRWTHLDPSNALATNQCIGWTAAVLVQSTVIAFMAWLTWRAQRLPGRWAALGVAGLPMLIATLCLALSYCVTRRVTWRGRAVKEAAEAENQTYHHSGITGQ
jgi:glycosyltransferase involved in cell wall biosynthesis